MKSKLTFAVKMLLLVAMFGLSLGCGPSVKRVKNPPPAPDPATNPEEATRTPGG